jgi:2-polyprenyl-6-methoxyphenol hydroxylase-like FAD-dependent oxidoreductase
MADQAVVLGAGIAGLAAAGVLAKRFTTVTVVERDRLPDKPLNRRGASQGRHLHNLLSRGSHILDELLPGFLADLTAAGVVVLDDGDLGRLYTRMGSRGRSPPTASITANGSRFPTSTISRSE